MRRIQDRKRERRSYSMSRLMDGEQDQDQEQIDFNGFQGLRKRMRRIRILGSSYISSSSRLREVLYNINQSGRGTEVEHTISQVTSPVGSAIHLTTYSTPTPKLFGWSSTDPPRKTWTPRTSPTHTHTHTQNAVELSNLSPRREGVLQLSCFNPCGSTLSVTSSPIPFQNTQ